MAVNHEACRAQWVKILTEAKAIADVIYKIKNYKRSEANRLNKNFLSNKEKKILYNYIKQFRKWEIEEYEIEDEPLDSNIANDIWLGYGKSTSKSSFCGVQLNDSFEIPFPKININSAEKEDDQDDEQSVPLIDPEINWRTPIVNKKVENDYSGSKIFSLFNSIESPLWAKSEDIWIMKQNKNLSSNIFSEESKEVNTNDSETLVKELDLDGDEIKFDSFDLHERLGKGNFGEVFRVTLKKEKDSQDLKNYALKAIKKAKVVGNNKLKYVISELNIMKKLKNPFIVSLNYAFQTPKYLYLAMEFWGGRDLNWHLDKSIFFEEEKARLWIAEVILAIEYLHSKNIIYRDLKPSNVMVTTDGHIKLTDFGLAKEGIIGMEYAETFWGSPAYLAPELLKDKKFNKSSDIYQIGVLFFELLTGKPPFYKASRDSLFDCIKNSYNLEVPTHVSPVAVNLMGKLLNKIPEKRLGVKNMDDLKNHEFFKSIDWIKLKEKSFLKKGIFTEEELTQAIKGQTWTDESIDPEEKLMQKVRNRVDFTDEDYISDEEGNPVRNNSQNGK